MKTTTIKERLESLVVLVAVLWTVYSIILRFA
jgi:hypothetical protein